MTPDNPKPIQWCFWCGKPMWSWHTPYLVLTLHGQAVTCSVCRESHSGGVWAKWDVPMVGWRDRRRLEDAEKRRRR